MPYRCVKVGKKWELQKDDGSKVFGTHSSLGACNKQMRAIYANEKVKNAYVVNIDGMIGEFAKEDIKYKLANSTRGPIHLTITSKGGSYLDALDIYNAIKEQKKEVRCHIPSFALSAGAVIALAADYISMSENAILMFHAPMLTSFEAKNADQMEKAAEMLRKCEDTLVTTIVARCGMKEEEAKDFIKNETWLTAKDALEKGIIDEVLPLEKKNPLEEDEEDDDEEEEDAEEECDNLIPDMIMNHVKFLNKELDLMPILDICSQFNLNVTNETAEEELTKYIKSLQPRKIVELPEAVINILRKSRETEINCLVSDGFITPVVAQDLKNQFLTIKPEFITEKGDIIDGFDGVMNAMRKNEKVLSFAGKAGTQKVPDTKKENALLKDMESRK